MTMLKRLRAARAAGRSVTFCERCAEICDPTCRAAAHRERVELRTFKAGAVRL